MKKAFVSVMIITAISFSVQAQKAKPQDRLASLNLSTAQKTSVDSVRKIYDGQRATLKADATVSQEDKTEKMKEIRKEQNKAINSILTDDQKKQLKKEDAEKKKKTDN